MYAIEINGRTITEQQTRLEAIEAANTYLDENLMDFAEHMPRNNQLITTDAELVHYEDGDELSREWVGLSAEYYHGDFAEHNTLWGA